MKKTKDMIKEGIWAGLNQPDITIKDSDVVVLSVPFDGGVSFRNGAKDGPEAIRSITYSIAPTTEDFRSIKHINVKDIGDVDGTTRDELFSNTEQIVEDLVKKNKRFTIIGGDHSITIPVLRGINKAVDKNFGIIHIDAHFDLCDTLEGDHLSHGSTERRALELEYVDSDSQFFIGIRSIEEDELEFISNNPVNVINAKRFNQLGVDEVFNQVKEVMEKFEAIYITLDIDCLDPAYAAGTGTPQFGGLTSRQLLDLLEKLFTLPIIGFDVVEVAPKLDPALTSVFAARKIITECWGHWF
jgi:agmatinase